MSDSLDAIVGCELDVDAVARRLYAEVSRLGAPVVGAFHLTCSDESEREVIDALQQEFGEYLLPTLKFGERAIFRIANLGGRYESGAVRIAEEHYATEAARRAFKVMLVKVNSHVAVDKTARGETFGRMRRYDRESVYCGALHALLDGSKLPFADELRRTHELRRLALFRDASRVDPALRSLFVAAENAVLQARRVVEDLTLPASPTLFLVLSAVTLNRKSKDSELVCGLHRVDWRTEDVRSSYHGLGDDPSAYRVERSAAGLRILDASA